MKQKCKHEPNGEWRANINSSSAQCKKCGKWYPTSLIVKKNYETKVAE